MKLSAARLKRAGDLKEELLAFSRGPRYEPELQDLVGRLRPQSRSAGALMELQDRFILQHRLGNGGTVVEEFVAERSDLPQRDRELLLAWREVVQQPFEVLRRDRSALIVEGLVDEMLYRVRSNMGPSVFDQMPRRSFLLARLVPIGDEWMLSGPTSVLPPDNEDLACEIAIDLATRHPEIAHRNPDKLEQAWELQRANRDRFIRHFGSDFLVVPGDEAQATVDSFFQFCRDDVLSEGDETPSSNAVTMALPPELVESATVALIFDAVDGLGYYAELGTVSEAFEDPNRITQEPHRTMVQSYLDDDTIEPSVLRRLAERDTDSASTIFRHLLQHPDFEWARDGEDLLRSHKAAYYEQEPRPKIAPISKRIATRSPVRNPDRRRSRRPSR
jgi:hypothetical protein